MLYRTSGPLEQTLFEVTDLFLIWLCRQNGSQSMTSSLKTMTSSQYRRMLNVILYVRWSSLPF